MFFYLSSIFPLFLLLMVGREVGVGEWNFSAVQTTLLIFFYWMVQSQTQMPNEWINDQQGYHSLIHCIDTSFPFESRLLDFFLFPEAVSGI